MIEWKKIFRKRRHKFSDEEIECAGYTDEGPLSQICPEFWEQYTVMGKNPKKLERIWEMEWDWYEAVRLQDFRAAKKLFGKLQKVKL